MEYRRVVVGSAWSRALRAKRANRRRVETLARAGYVHSPRDFGQWVQRSMSYEVVTFRAHDVRISGPLPPPITQPGASAGSGWRYRIGQGLARELTERPARMPDTDLASAVTVAVAAASVPAVLAALDEAPFYVAEHPGSLLYATGPGGNVLRMHGDTFSIVCRYEPVAEPGWIAPDELPPPGATFVLVDDLPECAVRVDRDPDRDVRTQCVLVAQALVMAHAGLLRRPD